MRILYVTTSYPLGAGETFLAAELRALQGMGHDVLVAPTWPRGERVHGRGERIWEDALAIPLLSGEVLSEAAAELWRFGPGLPRIAKPSRPYIALRNMAVLPKALWIAGLVRRWRPNHIHAYWSSVPATAAMVASRRTGVSWSFTLHAGDIYMNNMLSEKLQSAAFARCISALGLKVARDRAPTAPSPRLLHLGVDTRVEHSPVQIGSEFRILVPASLLAVKGHSYLLQALSLLKQRGWRVDLAGSGPLLLDLKQQALTLGLEERIRFLGLMPHQDLLARMSRGEWACVVLPSIESGSAHEGIPVALMEAMARGLPVIGTSSGGVPELLAGGAGVLVPPANPQALAEAIDTFISAPERLALTAGKGRQRILDQFDVEANTQVLLSWMDDA